MVPSGPARARGCGPRVCPATGPHSLSRPAGPVPGMGRDSRVPRPGARTRVSLQFQPSAAVPVRGAPRDSRPTPAPRACGPGLGPGPGPPRIGPGPGAGVPGPGPPPGAGETRRPAPLPRQPSPTSRPLRGTRSRERPAPDVPFAVRPQTRQVRPSGRAPTPRHPVNPDNGMLPFPELSEREPHLRKYRQPASRTPRTTRPPKPTHLAQAHVGIGIGGQGDPDTERTSEITREPRTPSDGPTGHPLAWQCATTSDGEFWERFLSQSGECAQS